MGIILEHDQNLFIHTSGNKKTASMWGFCIPKVWRKLWSISLKHFSKHKCVSTEECSTTLVHVQCRFPRNVWKSFQIQCMTSSSSNHTECLSARMNWKFCIRKLHLARGAWVWQNAAGKKLRLVRKKQKYNSKTLW